MKRLAATLALGLLVALLVVGTGVASAPPAPPDRTRPLGT
jgi:hypothetical protein